MNEFEGMAAVVLGMLAIYGAPLLAPLLFLKSIDRFNKFLICLCLAADLPLLILLHG